MEPFVDQNVVGSAPFFAPTEIATQARQPVRWRKALLLGSLLAAPVVAGVAVARLTRRRYGVVAGGLAAASLAALRLELSRWFLPEPAFRLEDRVGDLELRAYPARIEACAVVGDPRLEPAMERGYARLAGFLCGANVDREVLGRTTPMLTMMRDGRYAVSLAMPPGRTLDELPRPTHPGVELRLVPAHRIAALRFRGRFTRDNIAAHERELLTQLIDGGLSARGSVAFAAFDSPMTLPALRRNELWIEIL